MSAVVAAAVAPEPGSAVAESAAVVVAAVVAAAVGSEVTDYLAAVMVVAADLNPQDSSSSVAPSSP